MSNPFDDLKDDDGDEIVDDTPTTDETVDDRDEAEEAAETDTRQSPAAEPATSNVSESTDPGSSTATPDPSRSTTESTSTSASTPEPPRDEPKPDTGTDADGSDPAETGPAFEYSAVRQKPLYARDETWNDLEDELGITVTPELRRMGIRDEETREIHDAILKVAIEHIDEIPDVIADERLESA